MPYPLKIGYYPTNRKEYKVGDSMNIGIVGLGRMGMGMGARLVQHGHKVFGYDAFPTKKAQAKKSGITWVDCPAGFAVLMPSPRAILISVPAGAPVDDVLAELVPSLSPGDIIMDGGNSYYKDSQARAKALEEKGTHYLDVGISGGVWGLQEGFCLMTGGNEDAYKLVEPALRALAPENGCAYLGASGAGHYAKMVHNGIEYGMLEAYGEGFEIMKASPFQYDLHTVAELWNSGSVIRSWLLELAELAFKESPNLSDIQGWVEDTGEGRWTVLESIEERVPAPVIALSLMMRFRSRQDDSFSAKVIAALRQKFGGHAVKKE